MIVICDKTFDPEPRPWWQRPFRHRHHWTYPDIIIFVSTHIDVPITCSCGAQRWADYEKLGKGLGRLADLRKHRKRPPARSENLKLKT